MSSNLEESPLSDGKMDISDATNSFESAAVSPVIDSEHSNNHSRNSIDEPSLHGCEISAIVSTAITKDDSYNVGVEVASVNELKSSLNESEELQSRFKNQSTLKHDDASQKIILDNRCVENLCRPALLPLSEKHLFNLTVANSHPLMSPTGTDSDSENSCLVQGEANRKCQNFPDVVPNRERHMSQDTPSTLCYQLPVNDTKTIIQRVETSLVSAKNTLNINKALISKNKLSLLRAHSPDILSSGSEADTSLYHAAVEVDFQSVVLIPNTNNTIPYKVNGTLGKRNGEIAPAGSDDISSLDSISNHSFDDEEDLEHNLASLSPSSSLIDGLDDDNDDECEGPEIDDEFPERTTPTNMKAADVLPQYSAAEERRDSRNWQKITLPDGSTREIDMKVIEPYKRVLSHGGYLNAGGHNAIVLFCACHLPDRSRADYHYVMDNLFLYVVKTLEQLVTEDYVLIYLQGGSSRRNVPPFPWLKKCYQLLDRRLRKSLKNMYLVHPTFWIKSIVWMARPFVSAKFWRKLIYVKSLHELCTHVDVEKAAIPDKVKLYDAKHN